ncbi:hypothetical protein Lesp02_09880 [Lentzea sp. NBRC 105346]|nr:hypothetical protein Lesp02_09880 [Lentzea sp. NBRC 105346]
MRGFASSLPEDFPAAVAVVLHIPARGSSALPGILERSGPLPASFVTDRQRLQHGCIHVAPPDHHVLVEDGALRLSRGLTENGHRPSVDVLFRSAAVSWGPRTIGVVLSGALHDGNAGMIAIKSRGGVAVVQDPDEAKYAGMPSSVLRDVDVDHVLRLAAMGPVLARRVREQVEAVTAFRPPHRGAHAADGSEVERALWVAVRTLEGQADMAIRMRKTSLERGRSLLADRFGNTAKECSHAAGVLRSHLTRAGDHR